MTAQKQSVVEVVQAQRKQGRTMVEVLGNLGVARSSYYRWRKGETKTNDRRQSSYEITAEEKELIDEVSKSIRCIDTGASKGRYSSAGCICRCR